MVPGVDGEKARAVNFLLTEAPGSRILIGIPPRRGPNAAFLPCF